MIHVMPTTDDPLIGVARRPLAAYGSVFLLMAVATAKTLLTKFIFLKVPYPIAYSLLSASVTAVLLALSFIVAPGCVGRLTPLQRPVFLRLSLVCVAVGVDLGMSNQAIYLLPLSLQQAIASTIPAATILLETAYRRRFKPLVIYLVIFVLCCGAVMGSLDVHVTGAPHHSNTPTKYGDADRALLVGEISMLIAILSAACKYVFAKATIDTYRLELGPVQLFFWMEIILMMLMLPWALANGELVALLGSGKQPWEWGLLCTAAALGGFRFAVELVVLRYWSATTLSATNLTAHSFVLIISIPLFERTLTPLLGAGTSITLLASAAYAYLKVRPPEDSATCKCCLGAPDAHVRTPVMTSSSTARTTSGAVDERHMILTAPDSYGLQMGPAAAGENPSVHTGASGEHTLSGGAYTGDPDALPERSADMKGMAPTERLP